MAKKSDHNYSGGMPFNLRIPTPLYEQIRIASAKTGLSIQDVIRLAAEAGIRDLKRINYDIGLAISLQAEASEAHPLAAEAPAPYGEKADSTVRALAAGFGKPRKKPSPPPVQKR
jgi:hypothetical protein